MTYPQPAYIRTTNGNANAALTLGIIGFVVGFWAFIPIAGIISAVLGFFPALLAVTFGHMGRKQAQKMGNIGAGAAATGLILGYTVLAIITLTTVFWIIAPAIADSN